MSLLNQMLKDLDAQSKTTEPRAVHLSVAATEAEDLLLLEDPQRDWMRLIVWTLTVGALLIVLASYYLKPVEPFTPRTQIVTIDTASVHKNAAMQRDATITKVGVSNLDVSRQLDTKTNPLDFNSINEPAPLLDDLANKKLPVNLSTSNKGERPLFSVRLDAEQKSEQIQFIPLKITQDPQLALPKNRSKNASIVKVKPNVKPIKIFKKNLAVNFSLQSLQLAEAGELSLAEAKLKKGLARYPRNIAGHELLVALMIQGGRADEALNQIKLSLALIQRNKVLELFQSRLWIESGNDDLAIKGLLRSISQFTNNVDAMRLLAAVYQKQGDRLSSKVWYQKLTQHKTVSSSDWLGLAISLDGENNAEAFNAYQQALRGAGLREAAYRYATQRAEALH